MARGLIAFAYVVPEGWAIDITEESGDLVEQLIALMTARGIAIPENLRRRAGGRVRRAA